MGLLDSLFNAFGSSSPIEGGLAPSQPAMPEPGAGGLTPGSLNPASGGTTGFNAGNTTPSAPGTSGFNAGGATPGQPAPAQTPDPLGPSPNHFVNSFESTPTSDKPLLSALGIGATPTASSPNTGESFINSYEGSVTQLSQNVTAPAGVPASTPVGTTEQTSGGSGQTPNAGSQAAPDASPPRPNLAQPTPSTQENDDDERQRIEAQRRQWEFDKGIDPEAKRNRIRPAGGVTPSDSGYNLHRMHPKEHVEKPHRAVDIKNSKDGPVLSASDGTVRTTGHEKNLGNHVVVDFDDGMRGVYGHTKPSVQPGQRVRKGDPVGNTDLSGATTGPHLHFEVHDPKTGNKTNPEAYLPWRLE